MTYPLRKLLLVAGAMAVIGGVALAAQESRRERRGASNDRSDAVARAGADPFAERYGALLDNNIFLRDRRPARQPTTGPTTREAPPAPPEKSWMLVGVVFEDGGFHAYFENLQTSSVNRLTLGEPIANGAISEVYIDAIAYAVEGQVSWIEIGQDLTGAFPEGLATPDRPAAASGARTTAAPGQPNPNTLSIEERLRQRRLQESGGAAAPVRVQFEGGEAVILKGAQGEGAMILKGGSQVPPPGEAPPQRGSDTPPPDEPPPDDPGGRDPD